MPATYTTLELSDGTTTVDLVDGTNYALVMSGWAPQVPGLRASMLGGQFYEDVDEEITINVFGTTGAIALRNLATVTRLLTQARRWYRGENVAAVTLTVTPQGALPEQALVSLVLGSDTAPVSNPPSFNDLLMVYEIPDVRLRFRRRGPWLFSTYPADNLLTNSDFAGTLTTLPSPWQRSSTHTPTYSRATGIIAPQYLQVINGGTGQAIVIYQDVTAGPGGYNLYASAYINAGLPYNGSAVMQYYNGSMVFISQDSATISLTGTPAEMRVNGTAPSGTATIRCRFEFSLVPASTSVFLEAPKLNASGNDTGWNRKITEETTSTTAATTAQGTVQSVTWNYSLLTPSPLELRFTGITQGNSGAAAEHLPPGCILYTTATNRLVIREAELAAVGPNRTHEADVGNNAHGGVVYRVAFPSSTSALSVPAITTGLSTGVKRIGVFAAVRANTTVTEYTIQAGSTTSGQLAVAPEVAVFAPGNTTPQVIFVGTLYSDLGHDSVTLTVTPAASGGSLDIDYLGIVALDTAAEGATFYGSVASYYNISLGSNPGIRIRDRSLTHLAPGAFAAGETTEHAISHRGNAYLLSTGDTLVAMWLACAYSGTGWRANNVDGSAIAAALTGVRRSTFLTPQ